MNEGISLTHNKQETGFKRKANLDNIEFVNRKSVRNYVHILSDL
jgi:hypothetical protein